MQIATTDRGIGFRLLIDIMPHASSLAAPVAHRPAPREPSCNAVGSFSCRVLNSQMQQQKLGLKGDKERSSGATTGSTNSSLHRFSVDALAGTGGQKRGDLSSGDENSINSWDEVGDCSDDDIDVDDVGPPISPATSDSSRGDSSPANARRRK